MEIGKCTNSHGYSPFLVIAVCRTVGVRTTHDIFRARSPEGHGGSPPFWSRATPILAPRSRWCAQAPQIVLEKVGAPYGLVWQPEEFAAPSAGQRSNSVTLKASRPRKAAYCSNT